MLLRQMWSGKTFCAVSTVFEVMESSNSFFFFTRLQAWSVALASRFVERLYFLHKQAKEDRMGCCENIENTGQNYGKRILTVFKCYLDMI